MSANSKSVLIFGATGMFGRELYRESRERRFRTFGASRHGPDVWVDFMDGNAVHEAIVEMRPDIVINSGAIVSHSTCEESPELAYSVNSRPVAFMAMAARETGCRLVQISTDHFFSGDGSALHDEEAPVTLLNEYARTKYAGEAFALTCAGSLVVRTNITGFREESAVESFIEWVFSMLESQEEFNLFEDYFASTISTRQASSVLFDLLEHNVSGRINLACREAVSKKHFVETVADRLGLGPPHARSVSVHDFLSSRAESVGLDVSRAETVLGRRLPDLEAVVGQLVSEFETRKNRCGGISRAVSA